MVRHRLIAATAALGISALGFLAAAPVSATSDNPAFTVDQASAESVAAEGIATVLSAIPLTTPVEIGPVQRAAAYTPPGTSQFSQAAVANCSTPPPCIAPGVAPVVTNLLGVNDTAKAVLGTSDRTQCNGTPGTMAPGEEGTKGDFGTQPLPSKVLPNFSGSNACSQIAHAELLSQNPSGLLVADGVTSQAIATDCTSLPRGHSEIVSLTLGGSPITILGAPNTTIPLSPLVTIIINEQTYDAHGHGITVNALHVFTGAAIGGIASADIVVGHSHASVACDGNTVDTAPQNPKNSITVPIVTKVHNPDIAHPGDTISYTLTLNPNTCTFTHVIDTLPPTFSYVPKSASAKDLGTPTVTVLPDGRQQLDWFDPSGLPAGAPVTNKNIVETFQATISSNAAGGIYTNQVDTFSDPCGEVIGQDFFSVAPQRSQCSDPNNCPGVLVTTAAPPPPVLLNTAGGPPGFPEAGKPGTIQYYLLNPKAGIFASAVPMIVMLERASTLPTEFLLAIAALVMGAIFFMARALRSNPGTIR